jgi:hypothetical protein
MKNHPILITLTKVNNGVSGMAYRITRVKRAMSTHVAIPGRATIHVGDTLTPKEADLLCEQRNYEITIQ